MELVAEMPATGFLAYDYPGDPLIELVPPLIHAIRPTPFTSLLEREIEPAADFLIRNMVISETPNPSAGTVDVTVECDINMEAIRQAADRLSGFVSAAYMRQNIGLIMAGNERPAESKSGSTVDLAREVTRDLAKHNTDLKEHNALAVHRLRLKLHAMMISPERQDEFLRSLKMID